MPEEVNRSRQLILSLIRKGRFESEFSKTAPTEWNPGQVIDHRPDRFFKYFTPDSCWDYIKELLDDGHEIEIVDLYKPPGSKGYVMKVDQGIGQRILYIKLQVGKDRVIGRSFHYSEFC